MDRNKINALKDRMKLYDDDAKPLTGSDNQYTRLAIVGLRPERGNEQHFTLFAESTKLFDAIHRAAGTPRWIQEGFEKKWLYIEQVLRRPGATDTIDGYLQRIEDDMLWTALYEYLKGTGIMDRFAQSIKGMTYGLPHEAQADVGMPGTVAPGTVIHVQKRSK